VETDHVQIVVSDTGAGIPEENIGKIFDPFYTTKSVGSGTGMGLNTVYNIITVHGGTISAASTPGKGTTFTIQLPLAR
jgi:two-component system, NtrC family, sensor kinase